MKLLITGGAGFIGSWIIREVLNTRPDVEVINLDLLTYAGNPDNLADVESNPRYRFVHGDINDSELVDRLMSEVDGCIHSAAETHVDRSITHPLIFTQTNVVGTHTLLEAAKRHNLKRFVLVSTDEVYGSLPLDTPEKFTESHSIQPSSPYSASKAAADMLAMAYFHTYGLNVSITRCGNNYGPYQYPEKLIPFFILNALNGRKLPVYGDGLNVRDWIHVHDHATGILAVLDKGKAGEAYNIGADNQQPNIRITRLLMEQLGLGEEVIEYVADRPGHDRRYALDTSKIRRELGWQPAYTFEAALPDTIAWYQSNTAWIARVQERQQREKTSPGAAWLTSAKS